MAGVRQYSIRRTFWFFCLISSQPSQNDRENSEFSIPRSVVMKLPSSPDADRYSVGPCPMTIEYGLWKIVGKLPCCRWRRWPLECGSASVSSFQNIGSIQSRPHVWPDVRRVCGAPLPAQPTINRYLDWQIAILDFPNSAQSPILY